VDKFTGGPFGGLTQANAVFGPYGASADLQFGKGCELITEDKWGLMFEATIGVDTYNYRSLDKAIKAESGE
jgi:hypothetical protein